MGCLHLENRSKYLLLAEERRHFFRWNVFLAELQVYHWSNKGEKLISVDNFNLKIYDPWLCTSVVSVELIMAFLFSYFFADKKLFKSVTYGPPPKPGPATGKILLRPVGQNIPSASQSIGVNEVFSTASISSHTPCSGQPLLPMRACLKCSRSTFSVQKHRLLLTLFKSQLKTGRKEVSEWQLQRDQQHSPNSLS